MNKRRVLLLIVVLLAATSTISAAVVLAGEEDDKTSVIDKLSSKVAAILGLEETVVDAAIKQARMELKKEAVQARMSEYQTKLAALVEKGELTQEQADEKLNVFKSGASWKTKAIDSDAVETKLAEYQTKLAALVEKGELTQEQADEKAKWTREKTAEAGSS